MANEEKESKDKASSRRKRGLGGAIFLVCLFIGLGIGLALNEVTVGVLIGLGVGILGSVIVRWKS